MHLGFDPVLHCAEQQEGQVASRPPLPGTGSRTSGGDGITVCASQPTSRGQTSKFPSIHQEADSEHGGREAYNVFNYEEAPFETIRRRRMLSFQ
jgi:hypothetical protein